MGYTSQKQGSTHHTQRGFTLVEMFVAVTVLLIAIVAPMTIAQRGLQSAFFTQERITATYLAQEGLELMRATRDEAMMDDTDWINELQSTASECLSSDGCGYGVKDKSFIDCGDTEDACRLRYDDRSLGSAKYMYHHDSSAGDLSPYTRVIKIEEMEPGIESEVVVEVSWDTGLFEGGRSVVLTDRLFNYDI